MAFPTFPGCEVTELLESTTVTNLYRGIQVPLGRPVRIRALSASVLPSSPLAAELEQEARVLGALDHPGIQRLHDFGRSGDRMWLVLEELDGWSLEELLHRKATLSVEAVLALGLAAARALAHAHGRSVFHGSLSPAALHVGRNGHLKVVGFRHPALTGEPSRGASVPPLTPYRAPEEILGEPVSPRTDLYGLAAVLYRAATGHPPFDPDDRSLAQRIRLDPPGTNAPRSAGLPPGLEAVLHRGLEKLPSARWESAGALAEALRRQREALGVKGTLEASLKNELVFRELVPSDPTAPRQWEGDRRGELSLGRSVGILAAASALLLTIGAGLQLYDAAVPVPEAASEPAGGSGVDGPRGYLRVVATPWAHVYVDGRRRETTPFARPLELAAGRHFIRLEHPSAPPERRSVDVVEGQTVLLDVQMAIERPAVVPSGSRPAPADSSP